MSELSRIRHRNALAIIEATVDWYNAKKPPNPTRRECRKIVMCAIECAATESGFLNYANTAVPNSLKYDHDAIGHDHDSVGVMQQRVSDDITVNEYGWGTLPQCMRIPHATRAFLNVLYSLGYAQLDGPAIRHRIQAVQRSFDASGSNYGHNHGWALNVVQRNWYRVVGRIVLARHFDRIHRERTR